MTVGKTTADRAKNAGKVFSLKAAKPDKTMFEFGCFQCRRLFYGIHRQ